MSFHQDGKLSLILMILTSASLGYICVLLGLSIIFNILVGAFVGLVWNSLWNATMEWLGVNTND